MTTTWGRTLGAAVVVAALAGCGGTSGGTPVSLSARATSAAASAATAAETPVPTSLQVDDHVSLDRIRVVVRDVKLESHLASAASGGSADDDGTPDQGRGDLASSSLDDDGTPDQGRGDFGGDDSSDDGEVEVKAGPVVIDLQGAALAGAKLQPVVSVVLPEGTYDELKLKIHKLEDHERTGDAEIDAARASVIVDGEYDGKKFRFVSQLTAQERFDGTFVVGAGASNFTLQIDVTSWFSAGGASLDPSISSNRQTIEQNIRSSFRAFDDHDHDGRDDHGRRGADDGPNHT